MDKVDRFGMILIGFLIGAFLFSNMVVTEEVEVIKEVPVEVIVEKEVIKEVPVETETIKEVSNNYLQKKYKEGTYKVGRDIPAGEYKVVEIPCENSMMTPTIYVYIGENPNFNDYDEYDMTSYDECGLFIVEEGEYLQVNNGEFWFIE